MLHICYNIHPFKKTFLFLMFGVRTLLDSGLVVFFRDQRVQPDDRGVVDRLGRANCGEDAFEHLLEQARVLLRADLKATPLHNPNVLDAFSTVDSVFEAILRLRLKPKSRGKKKAGLGPRGR